MTPLADLSRQLMPLIRDAAREAGDIGMGFFRPGGQTTAKIWSKSGGSPVTEADVAVDAFLKVRLSVALPEAAWLSEETADDARRIGSKLVWIVDPIDGTRAFLSGSQDWSIAVALLHEDKPILGIVYAPAHGLLYEAELGGGATRNGERIAVSPIETLDEARIAGPPGFIDRLARRHPGVTRPPRIPSLALRIVKVADGSVDVGLVSSDARDWDIAAADIILAEAGGLMCDPSGRPPPYNRPDPCHGELMAVPARLQPSLIDAIRGT